MAACCQARSSATHSVVTVARPFPRTALVLPSVALVAALLPVLPYGYYILLRWVIAGTFVYYALAARERRMEGWAFVCWLTLAIYNPIVPLSLGRPVWTLVNLATLALIARFGAALRRSDGVVRGPA